jgi:quinoprotein dehydrogenase-associated probable ABC transporter substrate-binding protein
MLRSRWALFVKLLAVVGVAFAGLPAVADETANELRICADPNNLPFSDDRNGGVENAIAQLFAKQTGQSVAYTWWAQRRGFIRNTLKAGTCDVIMGVPVGLDMVETTRPYYRSSYVFVSRSDRQLDLASMTDPRLRTLKIGVQLIGDDGFNTPPGHALAKQGIVDNVAGYTVYGDYRQPHPPAQILEAVSRGEIDIAAVWGPLAGYFARESPVKLTVVPITDTERFAPLLFQFDIAIGVRKGDDKRKEEFDRLIAHNSAEIAQLLDRYGVPVLAADQRPDSPNPIEPEK